MMRLGSIYTLVGNIINVKGVTGARVWKTISNRFDLSNDRDPLVCFIFDFFFGLGCGLLAEVIFRPHKYGYEHGRYLLVCHLKLNSMRLLL